MSDDFIRRFARGARRRFPAGVEVVLTQYVIYDHPADYPTGYVVRAWHIVSGRSEPVADAQAWYVPDVETARAIVPEGLVNIGRYSNDDDKILEVWT